MKILVSAIACSPFGGSELYIGWSAVKCLSRDHELVVLTSPRHRAEIERAEAAGMLPKSVRFVYAGAFKEWHPNRLLARLQGWKEYIGFNRGLLNVAVPLQHREKFDLIHHVTYATWRVASPLWRLRIPFVLGPIGGNTNVPLRLLPALSPVAAGFEMLRNASNLTSRISPAVRKSITQAAHVFAADFETAALMAGIRGSDAGVSLLSQAFYSDAAVSTFGRYRQIRQIEAPLRLFAGGYLIGTKGVALALHALARVKAQNVKFHYRLGSNGPEYGPLRKLTKELGLENEVHFQPPLSGEDYHKELGAAHVFLLPSLRESAGLTMMEAMLAGCVPIVADCGGPARAVNSECGYKIPVSKCTEMIDAITKAIVEMDRNRQIILQKGVAATRRIVTGFSEENYRNAVNAVYASVKSSSAKNNPGAKDGSVGSRRLAFI